MGSCPAYNSNFGGVWHNWDVDRASSVFGAGATDDPDDDSDDSGAVDEESPKNE